MPLDGKKMARIRKAAGMIQLDLAKAVEINRVTVGDIEWGKLQPGAELAQRIADVLSIGVEDLHGDPQPDEPIGLPDLTAEEAQLLSILRSLSPVARARLMGFALGLAGRTEPESPGA